MKKIVFDQSKLEVIDLERLQINPNQIVVRVGENHLGILTKDKGWKSSDYCFLPLFDLTTQHNNYGPFNSEREAIKASLESGFNVYILDTWSDLIKVIQEAEEK